MSVEDKIRSFAHLLARQAAWEWAQAGSVVVSTLTSMTAPPAPSPVCVTGTSTSGWE